MRANSERTNIESTDLLHAMSLADLLDNWNGAKDAAQYRNELRRRAGVGQKLSVLLGLRNGAAVQPKKEPDQETNRFVRLQDEIEVTGYNYQGVKRSVAAKAVLEFHAERLSDWNDLDDQDKMLINIIENFLDVWIYYLDTSNKRQMLFRNKDHGRLRLDKVWLRNNRHLLEAEGPPD